MQGGWDGEWNTARTTFDFVMLAEGIHVVSDYRTATPQLRDSIAFTYKKVLIVAASKRSINVHRMKNPQPL